MVFDWLIRIMIQIPILSGIDVNSFGGFDEAYPVNLVPIVEQSGISNGYLAPSTGVVFLADGPGKDRGAIVWLDKVYRAMGDKLVRLNDDLSVDILGDIGGGGEVNFSYSFDRLSIASGGNLYYFNDEIGVKKFEGEELERVVDAVFVDGYFLITDGEFLIVTELNDPFSINPLKYGSSELDPDPVVSLIKIQNEVHAINRYTIEAFKNTGAAGFPFQRIVGAQINKGAVSTSACCEYNDAIAFVGSGRNESPSVWLGLNGQAIKISTRTIDRRLSKYTTSQLASTTLEKRNRNGIEKLYVHLPDITMVYDGETSSIVGGPVWHYLNSGSYDDTKPSRSINGVWAYNRMIVGDTESDRIGYETEDVQSQWGETVYWEFSTPFLYNESAGALISRMDLTCSRSTKREEKEDISVFTQFSVDGIIWSVPEEASVNSLYQGGDNSLSWHRQGMLMNWRIQRFRGNSLAGLNFSRLNLDIEKLMV